MHQIEGAVDFLKRRSVGDRIVNTDLPFHVPINNFGYVAPPARATKGGTLPNAAGHKLEGARGDLSA